MTSDSSATDQTSHGPEGTAGAFRAYWAQRFPWLAERWGDSHESHQTVFVRFLDTAADYLDELGIKR